MSFTIYSDVTNSEMLSSWINDLKTSETEYKPHLLNLMTCLSTTATNTSITRSVQLLIELHNELNRFLFEKFTLEGFMYWIEKSIPTYAKFISLYNLTQDMIEIEIQLMKQPLIRINQLYKKIIKLKGIDDELNDVLINKFKKLLDLAKDKNEIQNMNLDLNNFSFDKVIEVEQGSDSYNARVLQYFKVGDILERDYFEFKMIHQSNKFNKFEIVEVLKLRQNQIAICSIIEEGGRSLILPLLKLNEFEIEQNDLEIIHLSKKLNNNFEFNLFLQCPDIKQMFKWNNSFRNLNNLPIEYQFTKKLSNLQNLSNDRIGCGLKIEEKQELLNFSSLRKSSPIESKHDSLVGSLTLEKSSPLLDITNNFSNGLSITESNQTNSELNLNKFDKYKKPLEFEKTKTVKKRKSIFNLFKKSNEPSFDIVVKKPSLNSLKPNDNNTSSSTPAPSAPQIASSTQLSLSSSSLAAASKNSKPKETMASLKRNYKNLTINTSTTNISQNTTEFLPSPFNTTPTNSNFKKLTNDEEILLNSSNVIKIVKNSIILSKWNSKIYKWEIIGSSNIKNNTLKFLNNEITKEFFISLTSNDSKTPDSLIPLNNKVTKITKSNAKDLQLRCLDSINQNSNPITLTLRCLNVSTMNEIFDQFENILNFNDDKPVLKVSNSYGSEIFDDEKPSNSTSMSSISNLQDDIMTWGMPNKLNPIYGLKQSSLSTLSLKTPTSANSTSSSIQLQNLLLRKDTKIRLHKLDEDDDWIPVSFGKFSIYSNLTNQEFSKFEILYNDKKDGDIKMDIIVKNSNCSRIGKSGMIFESIDEFNGDELKYLLEFRNNKECSEIYELLV